MLPSNPVIHDVRMDNTKAIYILNFVLKGEGVWCRKSAEFIKALLNIPTIEVNALETDGLFIKHNTNDLSLIQFRKRKIVIYAKEEGPIARIHKNKKDVFGEVEWGVNQIWPYKFNATKTKHLNNFIRSIAKI